MTPKHREAIKEWLQFGEQMLLEGCHHGYYSAGGWAAETLRSLLGDEQPPSAKELVAHVDAISPSARVTSVTTSRTVGKMIVTLDVLVEDKQK